MIDGREVAKNIGAQHMAVAVAELLVARHRAVRAFAFAVGKGIVDETALENRHHHGAQGIMHHAITKGRDRNDAAFG